MLQMIQVFMLLTLTMTIACKSEAPPAATPASPASPTKDAPSEEEPKKEVSVEERLQQGPWMTSMGDTEFDVELTTHYYPGGTFKFVIGYSLFVKLPWRDFGAAFDEDIKVTFTWGSVWVGTYKANDSGLFITFEEDRTTISDPTFNGKNAKDFRTWAYGKYESEESVNAFFEDIQTRQDALKEGIKGEEMKLPFLKGETTKYSILEFTDTVLELKPEKTVEGVTSYKFKKKS